jgi:hypothetical protein
VTNEQLNAAAAKLMGWHTEERAGWEYWVDAQEKFLMRAKHYAPMGNLTQAWEFARAKDLWDWEMDRDWARVWMAPNRAFSEPHDGTPQDAARALTTCVLRANGVEV